MKDIVYVSAALINGKMTNDKEKIIKTLLAAKEFDFPVKLELVRTDVINFMVACGMDGYWKQLYDSPPIFQFTQEKWQEAINMGIAK